jgi:ADP-ribose pyrophosphatase YjhB (NUDIX family)
MSTAKERFKLIPAVYLLLRRNNEVLLLRRANTGYQDGTYSIVAGHLEGDELATTGIAREAKEEAGITVSPTDVRLVHTCHRLSRNEARQERVDLFFEASKWQGEITNAEPEKCDDLSWFPVDQLPDNMLPLVKYVVSHIAQGIAYSEYTEEPT